MRLVGNVLGTVGISGEREVVVMVCVCVCVRSTGVCIILATLIASTSIYGS